MRSSIVAGICLLMAASSVTADYYLSANQVNFRILCKKSKKTWFEILSFCRSSVTAGLPKLLSIKRTQNQKMHASVKPKVQDTEVVLVCKWDSWALTADPKTLRTSKPCWETVLKLTMHAIPDLYLHPWTLPKVGNGLELILTRTWTIPLGFSCNASKITWLE